MMDATKTCTKKNPAILVVQHQVMIDLTRKVAAKIKGISINVNDEISSTGGVKELILQLNQAVNSDPYASAALEQLRDILIQKHYGLKTWTFLEKILPSPARTRSKAGAGTYINSLE
jgi:hypothetical protein